MYKKKEAAINKLRNGANFQTRSFDLFRDDKEVVLQAVEQNGEALEFASENLKADKDVVDRAMKSNIYNFEHAASPIQDNKEWAMRAVSQSGVLLAFVSDRLKVDKEVVLAATKDCYWVVQYAHPSIQELCKGKDPVQALEVAIRMEKMQADLKPKPPSQKRGLKI